jgi:beta propeller repeat protein
MNMNGKRMLILLLGAMLLLAPAASGLVISPVCTEPENQVNPAISGDTIVWEDWRDADENWGNPLWYQGPDIYKWDPVNGEQPICTDAFWQTIPAISGDAIVWRDVDDMAMGALVKLDPVNGKQTLFSFSASDKDLESIAISGDTIVWEEDKDIYMWDPVNGVQPVCTDPSNQFGPAISGDTIVWSDWRNYYTTGMDIFKWDPVNGEQPVGTGMNDKRGAAISGDTIVWYVGIMGTGPIYKWDPVNGEQYLNIHGGAPAISGDTIVYWDDRNEMTTGYDIYMWDPVNGERPVCTEPGDQVNPVISGDIIAWADYRDDATNGADIYMADLSPNGDTTPPTVVSTDPSDGAVKVPVDTQQITIEFSEPIQYVPVGWKEVSLESYNSGGPDHYVDYPFGEVTVSGNTLIIPAPTSPDSWFDNWEYYYVTVAGVQDLAGNEMVDDGGNAYQFYFMTVSTDTTPPTVTSTDPGMDATGVPTDVTITATMSELINKCTGTVTMTDSQDNPVGLVGVRGYESYDYGTLTIQPTAPLAPGETYTVRIEGISDGHLNAMETPYTWSFTTQTADTTPPTVVSIYPEDGAVDVPVELTSISIEFSEPIEWVADSYITVTGSDGTVPVFVGNPASGPETTLVFSASGGPIALNHGVTYTVTVGNVQDMAGNVQDPNPYTRSFTTVGNQPPTAAFTADPVKGLAPLEVAFDASASSDPDGTVVSYAWNFENGATGTGITASRTYTTPGTYTATLTVTDDDGGTDTATTTIIAQTPAEASDDLITTIEGYELPADIEDGLTDKLDAAINALDKGNEIAALKILDAFIKQVEAQEGKAFTADHADNLIAEAQEIIESIQAS